MSDLRVKTFIIKEFHAGKLLIKILTESSVLTKHGLADLANPVFQEKVLLFILKAIGTGKFDAFAEELNLDPANRQKFLDEKKPPNFKLVDLFDCPGDQSTFQTITSLFAEKRNDPEFLVGEAVEELTPSVVQKEEAKYALN